MAKAGSEYQQLVALVGKALYPGYEVRVGQWVMGPDGEREVDVEVRGLSDGKSHFLLIECKDWRRPVGIEEIDALDSKRADLGADAAMICSNSGFTPKALRKSARLGIEAVSALAVGNALVRLVLERDFVAKRLSVDSWTLEVFLTEEGKKRFPEKWDARDLRYQSLPLVNWLNDRSLELLTRISHTVARKSGRFLL